MTICWPRSTAAGPISHSDAAPLAVKLVAAGWQLYVPPQSHSMVKYLCSGHPLRLARAVVRDLGSQGHSFDCLQFALSLSLFSQLTRLELRHLAFRTRLVGER